MSSNSSTSNPVSSKSKSSSFKFSNSVLNISISKSLFIVNLLCAIIYDFLSSSVKWSNFITGICL